MTATETEQRIIRYNDAFNETLAELLREDPDIFIACLLYTSDAADE